MRHINSYGILTYGSPNLSQTTKPTNNQQKKKEKKRKKITSKIVDFAVPADLRVKLKESEKKDKYLDLVWELKLINPFVAETKESAYICICICINVVINIIMAIQRVKWLQVLLFNTNFSIQHNSLICTQSKYCYVIPIIPFRHTDKRVLSIPIKH